MTAFLQGEPVLWITSQLVPVAGIPGLSRHDAKATFLSRAPSHLRLGSTAISSLRSVGQLCLRNPRSPARPGRWAASRPPPPPGPCRFSLGAWLDERLALCGAAPPEPTPSLVGYHLIQPRRPCSMPVINRAADLH